MQIQKIYSNQNFGMRFSPYLKNLLDEDLATYKYIAENSSSRNKQEKVKDYESYKKCVEVLENIQPEKWTLDVLKTWQPYNYNYDVYINTKSHQEHIGRIPVSEQDNAKHAFSVKHLTSLLSMLSQNGCFLDEDFE